MTEPRRDAGRIYFVLCFVAFAAVVLVSAQPPLLRDYPDWVYQGVLLAKTLSGHPVAGYAIKHYPVPNSITTVAIALLTLAFGWLWAAKLWMTAYLAIAAATIFSVARVFRLPPWMWWVLPTVLFFGQSFWYATISFGIGGCALLLLVCLLYTGREKSSTIGALIVFCFFMHLIVYAAAALLVLFYCLEHRRSKPVLTGFATLPLPIWYFAGRRLTPSNETALGYSPTTHLAVPAIVALLFILVVAMRSRRDLLPFLKRMPWFTGSGLFVAAVLSLLFPTPHLGHGFDSSLTMVRLKGLVPFQLFGFVNLIYQPTAVPLRSATVALLHRPLFLCFLLLDVACGLALFTAVANAMSGRPTGPAVAGPAVAGTAVAGTGEARAAFLWNYIALFGLLYLFCPPNALGVISIDMRLLQLALAPALFLLGDSPNAPETLGRSRRWIWVCVPQVVLLLLSLYQFSLSQRKVDLPTADTAPLPPQLAAFGAVDPTAIAEEYDRLRAGKLEGFIFATGLFYQTMPGQMTTGVGQ